MKKDIKNPKLIAKNGAFLFIRLLLVMAMAFYTTRLTLQILGDEDYGINNIIGGVISMFAIISMPITGAFQRFFNVEFTKQEIPSRTVFNTSLHIILLMTVGMVILYETVGLYLVNYVLKYPSDRTFAVNVIFQFTVLTTVCNFFSLVYSSLLVAKEDMGIPATVEILVAILKLVFLFVIPFISFDALIVYSVAIFIVSLFQLFFYYVYCWKKYEESHIGGSRNKKLNNEILRFSGWSFANSVAGISLTYLSNIFINVFGGILYNTAYGISQQLSNALVSFSTNVLRAADPQITSSTVAEQTEYRNQLVLSTMKICLLGVGFIYVLFLFFGDFLLELWLKHVPEYVFDFCRVSLFNVLISSIILPLRTIILASGNIKRFYLNYLYMAILANMLMFVLLKMGFPIITVMYLILGAGIGYFINALIIVNKTTSLSYRSVLVALLRVFISLVIGALAVLLIMRFTKISFVSFLLIALTAFAIVCFSAYLLATDKVERYYVKETMFKVIKR